MIKKAAVLILIPVSALAGAVPPPPPSANPGVVPPSAVKPAVRKGSKTPAVRPRPAKPVRKSRQEKRELILPAPEFLYREQGIDKFEKEKEKLARKKQLLELQVEIARLQQELEKYRMPVIQIKKAPERSSQETPRVNPAVELQKKYLEMRYQRERLRELQAKLSKLQSLFTGVMKVGNSWVAFDSQGRRYTEGSVVYGFVVERILPDGVVVASPEGEFKIPISASLPEKKSSRSEFNPPQPPAPVSEEAPPVETPPPEVPPPPAGGF